MKFGFFLLDLGYDLVSSVGSTAFSSAIVGSTAGYGWNMAMTNLRPTSGAVGGTVRHHGQVFLMSPKSAETTRRRVNGSDALEERREKLRLSRLLWRFLGARTPPCKGDRERHRRLCVASSPDSKVSISNR